MMTIVNCQRIIITIDDMDIKKDGAMFPFEFPDSGSVFIHPKNYIIFLKMQRHYKQHKFSIISYYNII